MTIKWVIIWENGLKQKKEEHLNFDCCGICF